MAYQNDSTNPNYDPSRPPKEAKLYGDNVSHGDRLKSTFDSSSLVSNGKAFGIEVPQAMAGTIRTAFDQLLPFAADWLGENSIRISQKYATQMWPHDIEKAASRGQKAGKAISYGLIGIQPIAETAANGYSLMSYLGELSKGAAPVLHANGRSSAGVGLFYSGGNEMVAKGIEKGWSSAMNQFGGTLARSVSLLPSLYRLHQTQSAKFDKQSQEAELELLAEHGDADQFNKYIEKHLENGSDLSLKLDGQLQKRLSDGRKEYMDDFKKFSKDKRDKVEKEVSDALKDGSIASYVVNYNILPAKMVYNEPNPSEKFKVYEKRIIDARLKERFASESGKGAWDSEFQPAARNVKDRPKTRSELIAETHQQLVAKIQEKVTGKKDNKPIDKESQAALTSAAQLAASLGGEALRGLVTGNSNKTLEDKIGIDLVFDFKRALDENSERATIPGGEKGNQEFTYAQMVHEIFQQHQHDMGQPEIGDRYVKSMRAVNWSDTEIQKMNDSDLNEYEVAVKHMSQYIRDGRMDPLALINLVGERKIVQASGKSFGTLQSKDQQAVKENVIAEIDHQAALLRPKHTMDQQEISQAMANYTFSKEELQAAFSNHGLQGDARAFLFMLLDSNTPDDKVLKDLTGRSDTEIKQLRESGQKMFSTQLDAALREIADDLASNPAAIERYEFTQEEAAHFQEVYRKAKETGGSIGDVLEGDARKEVAASVANTLVDDALHHQGRLWQDRIKPHAEQTVAQNQEAEQQQKEQKEALKAEAFNQERNGGFAQKLDPARSGFAETMQPAAQNDNSYQQHMNSQPFVSQDMQRGYDEMGPAKPGYADRLRGGSQALTREQAL